ncbi:hypothetical protein HWI79_3450, partial [Cryptosporidium felis]
MLGVSGLEGDNGSFQSEAPLMDLLDWKYERQTIGKERQLLVLWLMDPSKFTSRLLYGDLPNFKDIKESLIIPNIKIKYFTFDKSSSFSGKDVGESCSEKIPVERIFFPPLSTSGNFLKESLYKAIKSFFFSEKYTVILSPGTSPSNLNYFNNLSILEVHLFPSLTKFPIIIQETLEVLTFPHLSNFIG